MNLSDSLSKYFFSASEQMAYGKRDHNVGALDRLLVFVEMLRDLFGIFLASVQ
jgi:hypothetical protein